MTLSDLPAGTLCRVTAVNDCPENPRLRLRLMELGLTKNCTVRVTGIAPAGDPVRLSLRGYSLSLRRHEADLVSVEKIGHNRVDRASGDHPPSTQIRRADILRLPPQTGGNRVFLLAGNPNCGKSTLFNALTGGSAHTGNFPGVTVEISRGALRHDPSLSAVDLPGLYSLNTFSPEETAARSVILGGRDEPASRERCVICVIDSTRPERGLYLLLQILGMTSLPVVLALNLCDALRSSGGSADTERLSSLLGIPVVAVSARTGEGLDELTSAACRSPSREKEKTDRIYQKRHDTPNENNKRAGIDSDDCVEEMICERFDKAEELVRECFILPEESASRRRTAAADRILLGKFTAYPCLAAAAAIMMYLTFGPVGGGLSRLLSDAVAGLAPRLGTLLSDAGMPPVMVSFFTVGVLGGVGSVIGYLPVILCLFLCLSLLEDSGYTARAAYLADRPMRAAGLSGRSLIPMLVGFGCTVPAVLAARTIPDGRERRLTAMLVPFVSCSAKLPVYAVFCAAFFPGRAAVVCDALYLGGIVLAAAAARIIRRIGGGKSLSGASNMIVELPDYRLPTLRGIGRTLRERVSSFFRRAFTVILAASAAVWFLGNFTPHFLPVTSAEESLLYGIGSFLAPVFAPLGFGSPAAVAALISGLFAKEAVVSTLTVLSGGIPVGDPCCPVIFTSASAAAYLVFILLYTPCAAAVSVIRRETDRRTAVLSALGQCAVAYAAAALTYTILK